MQRTAFSILFQPHLGEGFIKKLFKIDMNKFNIRSEKEKSESNGDVPTDFKQFSLFKDLNHGYWLCVVVNADVLMFYKFCL